MSFWGNDDSRARELAQRKEEERRRAAQAEKARAAKAAAARAAAKIEAQRKKELKAERDAEDKKLRDELVEKMLNGGKDKRGPSTFPTLNRGFGGDRAQPTNQQQCFQHLKNQPHNPPNGAAREEASSKEVSGATPRSGTGLPPLRRPF